MRGDSGVEEVDDGTRTEREGREGKGREEKILLEQQEQSTLERTGIHLLGSSVATLSLLVCW